MYQNVLKGRRQARKLAQEKDAVGGERPVNEKEILEDGTSRVQTPKGDLETQPVVVVPALAIKEIKLSIADINPFPPFLRILSRRNNLCILTSSGT